MVAARWDKKTGEWAGKKRRAGEDFLEGGKSIRGGRFLGRSKKKLPGEEKGFFFFWRGPEARGELEMGGFGRWKS